MFQNGRVNTTPNNNFNAYDLFKESKQNRFVNEEAIKNIHAKNDLSDVFFSRENIDTLQEAIRYMVYKKSCGKHIIDKQSETDLIIVMRSIYLQYGEHRPFGVFEQVKELNTKVLEYCVPKILEEINIYLQYKHDISALPIPLDRGEFSSSKGTKVLEQTF